ncbi:MAG: FAD:protein FMN transferase [Planctomycetes bacterium]|nr:FAD:protein FMN transferase [Planctomycetota bacterium]
MRPHPATALLTVLLPGCATAPPALERFAFEAPHMGTAVRIVAFATDRTQAERAAAAAFARIAALDAMLSDYRPTSDLSELPRRAFPAPATVAPELFDVLARAQRIAALTDGAFDVTIGPAVRLWRRAVRQRELPTAERLAGARARIGWRNVELLADAGSPRVRLALPDMQLDLGGIAKGFAAREALAALAAHGVDRALVDAGGDLALGAPPPGRRGWIVGLVPLEETTIAPGRTIELAQCGIATSGDAFQSIEIGGVRYAHIVDPATGLGVTTRVSATVIAPDPADADALASALCVLDPERGLALVGRVPGAAALLVWADADGATHTAATPGFPEATASVDAGGGSW